MGWVVSGAGVAEPAACSSRAREGAPPRGSALAGRWVLVVDDNLVARVLLAEMLAAHGATVAQAGSAEEALALLRRERADLLLTDDELPGMSGIELTRCLRADPRTREVPIIVASGAALDDRAARVAVLEAGADDCLPKPPAEAELIARARALLRTRDLVDRARDQHLALQARRAELTSMLAHDMRNLTTSISGYLQLLADAPCVRESSDLAGWIEAAARNAHTLIQLMDTLVDLHRLESRAMPFTPELLPAEALASVAVAQGQALARVKQISLSASGEGVIRGDRALLERALLNLVGNAVKFTPAGGQVSILVRGAAGQGEISVQDSGEGISELDLPHVFDRFYQGRGARLARGGAGIGLAFCREVALLHGGSIEASSEPGRGARFTLRLPGWSTH